MAHLISHSLILLFIACFCFNISAHKVNAIRKNSISGGSPQIHPQENDKIMNVIDSCWRSNPDWATNRQSLADCAIGFGDGAMGGQHGAIYVVTDTSDDPVNPKPGSLRYGVIQSKPLWIVFSGDMVFSLEHDLLVNSFKTIDGRGANVEIANLACIVIEEVKNVIIHGIKIHDCKPGKKGSVRKSPHEVLHRGESDGDGITVKSSSNIWIDHCFLARCTDGLIDVTHASTLVTISNNYFTQHDKVMLLGHSDDYTDDKAMKVTVVFNHFGPDLKQRMPRVRFGYAHVANNKHDEWLMYAIGGSADPTIFSEGNFFVASNDPKAKEVTQRETHKDNWKSWKWMSIKDCFVNGAYFTQSGSGPISPDYTPSQLFDVADGIATPMLTSDVGPLQNCYVNKACI